LEELIFVEMKLTADRTDISAVEKVNKIKAFIEQVRDVEDDDESEGAPEPADADAPDPVKEEDAPTNGAAGGVKRPADEEPAGDAKAARIAKEAQDAADGVPPEGWKAKGKEVKEGKEGDSEEETDVDCCVVCGLHRGVFKEDTGRELHHYLSHGFNILKEFDILKPDDTIFLICNICNSPFPRQVRPSL
jgi:hypothetical protein